MMITGLYTALITPFSNGRVDYGRLKEIVEHQIAGGVDGILPTGSLKKSLNMRTADAESWPAPGQTPRRRLSS